MIPSVWACEKFDRYLCGLENFRLQTDHKPLVPLINGTDLNSVPLRCYCSDMSPELRKLHSVRSHLSVAQKLLIYDDKIVIPEALRKTTLEVIHHGHQGITKCKERANTGVWWCGIGRDISDMVRNCQHCQIQRSAPTREPLKSTELPNGPWERVGTDLLTFEGHSYLVTVDYYSRFIELTYLAETTSVAVIAKLKSVFARWGIPVELISDNGPQYSSDNFRKQSNGMAERAVQTAKRILKQKDPFLALLIYRATPLESTGFSPAELAMNRKIRILLPSPPATTEPKRYDREQVEKNDLCAKQKYEYFYNRRYSVRPLPDLSPGDTVRVRTDHDKVWSEPATVVAKSSTPRSYNVRTERGEMLRRNRKHIMVIPGNGRSPDKIHPIREPSVPKSTNLVGNPSSPVSNQPAPTPQDTPVPVQTKSGRHVKPPDRLDI